ncbi:MAG: adenosylmethionine decarboxylase [Oscillatoriales cyanobacterium]|jgi:S-adenosylmethionine decarboxylase|nr:MAG: adenosylmethionine decarboxylase [Oscillatoriales cyanobacterium]
MQKNIGTHLVVDAWEAPSKLLNDPECIRQALLNAISAGGATLIDLCVHQFSPHGVTATATLAESHIAIHTWPEYGYFAADIFFCGAGEPQKALEFLKSALQADRATVTEVVRRFEMPSVMLTETASTLENCDIDRPECVMTT